MHNRTTTVFLPRTPEEREQRRLEDERFGQNVDREKAEYAKLSPKEKAARRVSEAKKPAAQ